jgi:hypothetical protein
MGLSYHFTFSAPATVDASELVAFLKSVEQEAKQLGFDRTMVLDAEFNTPERQKFARQLTTGLNLESERLKGVVPLREGQVWSHDGVRGSCRIIPERGVLLVVTDVHKCETIFGFLKYPSSLKDLNDKEVAATGTGGKWMFRDFVNSPDERFRKIVKRFNDAGYVEAEHDEFSPPKDRLK